MSGPTDRLASLPTDHSPARTPLRIRVEAHVDAHPSGLAHILDVLGRYGDRVEAIKYHRTGGANVLNVEFTCSGSPEDLLAHLTRLPQVHEASLLKLLIPPNATSV